MESNGMNISTLALAFHSFISFMLLIHCWPDLLIYHNGSLAHLELAPTIRGSFHSKYV
jgi:hypothetical protein